MTLSGIAGPVAHALVRAVSALVPRPVAQISDLHQPIESRLSVDMSGGRSPAGTSLAAETPARPVLCFQWFAPGFLASVDAARKSARAT